MRVAARLLHSCSEDRRPAATSARTPLPAISISAVKHPIAPIVHITARPKVVNRTDAKVAYRRLLRMGSEPMYKELLRQKRREEPQHQVQEIAGANATAARLELQLCLRPPPLSPL